MGTEMANGRQRSARVATADVAAEFAGTASVREMMAELDAIAAERGITWTGAEVANVDTSERTRYAQPGQRCGRGVVRVLSAKQVRFIKFLFASRDTRSLVRLPGSEDIEHMSLRGARDLIDRLLACPELPKSELPAPPAATEAQLNYLRMLAARKGYELTGSRSIDGLSKREASALIDELQAAPYVARPATVPATTDLPDVPEGHYAVEIDGTLKFYQVDRPTEGKWAGYLFLKVQASDETYPIKNLTTKRSILAEIFKDWQAAGERYGREIGRCYRCHRTLTDETSRALGIGPDCRSRL